MKICLINNLYPPYFKGGAECVVENTAQGLTMAGHNVFVITLDEENSPQVTSYKIYHINPWNIFSYLDINKRSMLLRLVWWFFNIFNFSSNRKIKKILLKEKPDIVHTHNLCGIGFLVPRLIKKLKIKHVHTLHDIQLAYPSGQLICGQENSFKNKIFLRVWYEKLICYLFNSPDIVISPSKWLMEFYNKRGFFRKSKKIIMTNPVIQNKNQLQSQDALNIKFWIPAFAGMTEEHGSWKTCENPDSDKINFLYVGRVEVYKGVLFLINTFNSLHITHYSLHIVGEGKDLQNAKNMTKNNDKIIFHGALDKEQLNKLYEQCNVLIMPTLTYENCPMVILEALNFGLPVVASKIGGIIELVIEKQNGWLFEPGNQKELTQILQNLIHHPEKIKKTAQNLKQQLEKHELESYILKLERAYVIR